MPGKEIETFYPKTKKQWRAWLQKNHAKKDSIWLVGYKKEAAMPTVSWSDAVDEALCFGWIDSTRKSTGNGQFIQYFTRRKPKSNWSKINKEKVKRLVEEGLMTEAGLKSIEIAKQNGSWNNLDSVEELQTPKDLEKAFKRYKGSKTFFDGLSRSVRKMILHWVISAKKPETRQKRIEEVASLAAQKLKPRHY